MWEIKRKDGTYFQERVTDDITGEVRIISVKLKDDSRLERKKAKEKLELKIAKKKPRKDFLSEVFRLYDQAHEKTIKESSLYNEKSLEKNILETIGDLRLERLTAGIIKQKLIESGKAPSTMNKYIKQLKSALKWAYMNDIIDNSAVYEKLLLFPEPSERVKIQDKYLEQDELEALLDALSPRDSLFARFLALTGMRVGEAIALDNGDIWNGEIHITKHYSPRTKKITTPKTLTSNREIHIQPELMDCIRKVQQYMRFQQAELEYPPRPYLFVNTCGNRIVYDTIERAIHNAGQRALNRDITCHVLRHTHASMLAAAGYPLEAISRRLGHDGSAVTKAIYVHQTQKLKEREAEQLDKITFFPRAV